jgi:hypothetical protein
MKSIITSMNKCNHRRNRASILEFQWKGEDIEGTEQLASPAKDQFHHQGLVKDVTRLVVRSLDSDDITNGDVRLCKGIGSRS